MSKPKTKTKNIKLQILMIEHAITQSELSQLTGVPQGYISESINGKRNLEDFQKENIARVLGTYAGDIFG